MRQLFWKWGASIVKQGYWSPLEGDVSKERIEETKRKRERGAYSMNVSENEKIPPLKERRE